MELTRRDLLKGAAALGAAATVPLTAGGLAVAQTTQKKELVTAQAGDISKFDPHFSTSSNVSAVHVGSADFSSCTLWTP